jgi:surface polysaccharide O-acyltransferase-like enzyme
VEVNRLPLYAVYFLFGVALGAYGLDRTFLAPGSSLARRWAVWVVAAGVAFAASVGVSMGGGNQALVAFLYTLSSATSGFAILALFLRFARTRREALDSLFASSYGIYVIHYGVLAWLAYALLDVEWPAMAKWAVAFPVGLALCWGATALLRRIPLVARVI